MMGFSCVLRVLYVLLCAFSFERVHSQREEHNPKEGFRHRRTAGRCTVVGSRCPTFPRAAHACGIKLPPYERCEEEFCQRSP